MSNITTQFKKGQSGNPKGAPKRDWTWAGELQKAVEEMTQDGKSIKYHISHSLIREALKGNVIAQKELMNRMDGMPAQDINQTGTVVMNVQIVRKKANGKTNTV